MRRNRFLVLSALFGMAGLFWMANAGDLEPPGPPAPTMKDLDDVEPRTAIRNDFVGLTPIVISSPGSYYLAEDISAMFGQHGIEITTSNVTLDMNGFTIYGNTEVGSLSGIHAEAFQNYRNITILNGTIQDFFEYGLDLGDSIHARVERVRVYNNGLGGVIGTGIRAGNYSRVIDSSSFDNFSWGIVAGVGSVVTGCTAVNNGQRGISLNAGSVVHASVAYGNGTDGIGGNRLNISHSNAGSNGGDGIVAAGGLAIGNTAATNTGTNISLGGTGTSAHNHAP